MLRVFVLSVLSVLCCVLAYSQQTKYSDRCEMVRALLDSADRTSFGFISTAKDSTITVWDVNGILTECSISTVHNVKLKVVDSGDEINKVKMQGILSIRTRQEELFVLTQEQIKDAVLFRLFYPMSNAYYYWIVLEKEGVYYFKERRFGDF